MRASSSNIDNPAPFLLEIGTEELPVGDLDDALEQLEKNVPAWLEGLRLAHGEVRVMGTPRRLVVLVENLQPRQPDLEQVVKGPPADRAFDAQGTPTQAGIGFARSKGLPVDELVIKEMDGGRYAAAVVRLAGRHALDVLSEALPGWIAALRFEKPMRWNQSGVAFSRPIRWLLALYGAGEQSRVIPFEYGGLQSGRTTRGLRFHQPVMITVTSPGLLI